MSAVERQVVIANKRGLHARASKRFVDAASAFDAQVTVAREDRAVRADSIMELLMLAAGPGVAITVRAEGADAAEAVNALCALVEDRFGEGE